LSAEKAVQTGCKKILLLGTSFTMEDGFFAAYFTERGVEVVTPSAEDRQTIQSIQTKIALGENPDPHRPVFGEMLKRYKDVDAIVLACTELPLVIDARNAPKPLINPIDCQCEAAAAFAFVE
jgi:aspartate racemase